MAQGSKTVVSPAILKPRPRAGTVSFLPFFVSQSKPKSQRKLKGRGKGRHLLMGEEAPTGMEGLVGNSPHRPATTVCLLLFPFLPLPVLMIGKTFTSFQLQN